MFAVAILLSSAIFALTASPDESAVSLATLVRDGLLAATGLGCAAFALRNPSLRCAPEARGEDSTCSVSGAFADGTQRSASGPDGENPPRSASGASGEKLWGGRNRRAALILAGLALIGCAAGWTLLAASVSAGADGSAPGAILGAGTFSASGDGLGTWLPGMLALLATCLFTGVFEESVFRVLLIGALEESGPSFARRPWFAAAASAVLFALMHVDAGLPVLRFLQTAAFGFLMAELYLGTRSFWLVVLAHGAFDVLLFGPVFLTTGALPSFSASLPGTALVVGASAAAVAVLVLCALPFLRPNDPNATPFPAVCDVQAE